MAIGTGLALLGSAIIGGGLSKHSADKQAKAVKSGETAALNENARQFDLTRADTAPARALGASAIDRINRLYGYTPSPSTDVVPAAAGPTYSNNPVFSRIAGRVLGREPITIDNSTGVPVGAAPATGTGTPDMTAFFESPDYQFNLAEGQKALNRSLVARSGALSGAGAKEGVRYASGMASREFGSFVDRLMQQAGLGSNGTSQAAAAGANSANNVASVAMNGANTRASIYGNNAANVNNAIQGGIQNWMLSKYLGDGGGGVGRYPMDERGPWTTSYPGMG